MNAEVTHILNEGFRITTRSARILVDAFLEIPPRYGHAPVAGNSGLRADIILVTHAHWDHFDAAQVADAAARSGARVVGPQAVIRRLRDTVAPDALIALEPPLAEKPDPARCVRTQVGPVAVTAFRTFHSKNHNSYLVETPGFRWFHDGDNEDTRRIDASALGRLDALFIAPWQGSGWVEFIESLKPRRWFIMHLTEEELDAHEAGEFLPDLCSRVPDGLVALRPGGTFVFD